MFVDHFKGLLMKVSEDQISRYRFEVWFDYTREAINTITEGSMIAVPNFGGTDTQVHYSILEITGILPIHYALGTDISGYPGFVLEAARNAGQDWLMQDTTSTEDTTKIRCIALPTNLEIVEKALSSASVAPSIQSESNLPMVGHSAYLLDTPTTERVVNLALDLDKENVIKIGTLVRDPGVCIYLRVEDLIKVHFGIFGFTGAGKSNLLSTLVHKLFTESQDPVKVVIFDLMSEYTALLIDLLIQLDGARIINIGHLTVPESVLRHLGNRKNLQLQERAANDFLNSTILPKAFKRRQNELGGAFLELFERKRIWMLEQVSSLAGSIIKGAQKEFKSGIGNCEPHVNRFIQELAQEHEKSTCSAELVEGIKNRLEVLEKSLTDQKINFTSGARSNMEMLLERLTKEANRPRIDIPASSAVSIDKIIERLNDPSSHTLLILQAHNPDELREFASTLGGRTYEARRRTGQITPLVSFIFDEADEFMPSKPSNESYGKSKSIAMTLARRGRKFGLGIGIATQRIANLDVNTLSQPHTYFVSKLPRQYDRETIANAFGISEETFRQTFKFKKGDWLLASYDAAGLEAIPIPIHVENAEERVLSQLSL